MERLLNRLWFRIGLVLALGMTGYVFLFLMPQLRERARQQLPQKQLVTVRTAINQNYIAYQALANYRGGSNSDPNALLDAESDTRNSLKTMSGLLDSAPKEIAPHVIQTLKDTAEKESALLNVYSGRYYALQKPLAYIPEGDITLSNMTEAAKRATTAYGALAGLARSAHIQLKNPRINPGETLLVPASGTFALDRDSQQALLESAACFSRLANALTNTSPNIKSALEQCVAQYPTTRIALVKTITEPLRTTEGQRVLTNLRSTLHELDSLISY